MKQTQDSRQYEVLSEHCEQYVINRSIMMYYMICTYDYYFIFQYYDQKSLAAAEIFIIMNRHFLMDIIASRCRALCPRRTAICLEKVTFTNDLNAYLYKKYIIATELVYCS